MEYTTISAGEAVPYKFGRRQFLACCDCGLVHSYEIRKVKGGRYVELRFWRDKKETSKERRFAEVWNFRYIRGFAEGGIISTMIFLVLLFSVEQVWISVLVLMLGLLVLAWMAVKEYRPQ